MEMVEDHPDEPDVAEIADALRREYQAWMGDPAMPSAARVWWRAETRARRDAARRVAQPLVVALAIAAACTAGVAIAFLQVAWTQLSASISTVAALSSALTFPQLQPALVIGLGVCVLLTPIALYFVLSDK